MFHKTTIALITNPTKTNETEALESMARVSIDAGGYLKSLFTDSLVQWAEDQIRKDLAPDIWAELMFTRAQNVDLGHQVVVLRQQAEILNGALEAAVASKAQLKDAIAKL
jgi:hypothetical protein